VFFGVGPLHPGRPSLLQQWGEGGEGDWLLAGAPYQMVSLPSEATLSALFVCCADMACEILGKHLINKNGNFIHSKGRQPLLFGP
jgi:hypothetical protein